MTDRDWCPGCREPKRGFRVDDHGDCKECGTAVVEDWPLRGRLKHWGALAAGVAILAGLLFAPVWYGGYLWLFTDAPLFASAPVTKCLTVTRSTGVLSGAISVLPLSFLIILIWIAASVGPRRM
ncbi:hypothetical protein [Halobaculum sp. D14]|uniref:hypothetical protein n=1 Tax=Halobaculum sp. D14 TaxID=3421642 RepID=UPI003EB7C2EB